mgnify:CR=1 FL=1|jgi:hypothetical protein
MSKFDYFLKSTLKVTASEDLNIEEDLKKQDSHNQSISDLLEKSNDEKKEETK